MTRPTAAELARYRRDMPSLKWVSRGIWEQLLAEIEHLEQRLAEAERRNACLWEMLDWWGKQHPSTRVHFIETSTISTGESPPEQ
jgi:hypothetical protein